MGIPITKTGATMKKDKRLFFRTGILLFLITLAGCEEESKFKIEENQQIIFHYSYENFAIGYQFYGWCIDKDGVVWDLEEPIHWNDEEQNILDGGFEIFLYEKDSIENIYENSTGVVLGKVRENEFEEKLEQIEDIIYTDYSTADSMMADAGSAIYGFLSFDTQTNKYRRVILEFSGDWYSSIQDESAEALTDWLKKLQEIIGYPDFN